MSAPVVLVTGANGGLGQAIARAFTVNAVCPGFVETEAVEGQPPDQRKQAEARIPMRRFGRPEEVAAAVKFLACREAGYITGSIMKIDGGLL